MNHELSDRLHVEYGAYPKFSTKEKLNGGILEIPKNIFTKKTAITKIYDIDGTKIDIYVNGAKSSTESIPTYATRCFIVLDSYKEMDKRGYSPLLVKFESHLPFNEDNFFISFLEVLPTPKKDHNLEDKIKKYWLEILAGNYQEVEPEIKEGYDIVFKLINGESND